MLLDGYGVIIICSLVIFQQVTLSTTSPDPRCPFMDQFYDTQEKRFNEAFPAGNSHLSRSVTPKPFKSEDYGVPQDQGLWEGNRYGSNVDKYYNNGNLWSDILEATSAVLSEDDGKAAPQAFLVIAMPSDTAPSDRQTYPQIQAESHDPPRDPFLGLIHHGQGIGTLLKTDDKKFQIYPDSYNDWAEIRRTLPNYDDSDAKYVKPIFREQMGGSYSNNPNPSWNRLKREAVEDSPEPLSKFAQILDQQKKEMGSLPGGIKKVVKPAIQFFKDTFKSIKSPDNAPQESFPVEWTPNNNDILLQPIKEGSDAETVGGVPESRPSRAWDIPFSVLDIDGVIDTQNVIGKKEDVVVMSSEPPPINDIAYSTDTLEPYDAAECGGYSAAKPLEENYGELPGSEGWPQRLNNDKALCVEESEQAEVGDSPLVKLIETVLPPIADAISYIDELLMPPPAETSVPHEPPETLDHNNTLLDDIAESLEFQNTREVDQSTPGGTPPYGLSPGGGPHSHNESWQQCLITPLFPLDGYKYRVCITAEPVENEPQGSGSRRPPTILEDIIFYLLAQAEESIKTGATQPSRVSRRSADNRLNSFDHIKRLSEAQH